VTGGPTWGWAKYDAILSDQQRALRQRRITYQVLDRIELAVSIDVIIHGDERGAAMVAKKWADERGVPHLPFTANWGELGNLAGPMRNSRMLDEGQPELVLAFPGLGATSDMLGKAIDATGVEVVDLQEIENAEIQKEKDSHVRCR
jgi:hypothetical protein